MSAKTLARISGESVAQVGRSGGRVNRSGGLCFGRRGGRIGISRGRGGAMPFLYPILTAGRQTLRTQQGPQGQQMLGGHEGCGGQFHATTRGAVEHPVGQFEWWCEVIIIQPTPEHGASGSGERRHDEDEPTGPRVPGIAHLAAVADMGLVWPSCTTGSAGTRNWATARRSISKRHYPNNP